MHFDWENMRKRRKQLLFKLMAGGILLLLLLRMDFLRLLNRGGFPVHPSGVRRDGQVSVIQDTIKGSGGKSLLREMLDQAASGMDNSDETCSIPYLKNAARLADSQPGECVQAKPKASSCRLAEEIFGDPLSRKQGNSCDQGQKREFCRIARLKGSGQYSVSCNLTECSGQLYLGVVQPSTGDHRWTPYQHTQDIELAIVQLLEKENTGFCLVQCSKSLSRIQREDRAIHRMKLPESFHKLSQILVLPPHFHKTQPSPRRQPNVTDINFNFIFLDSVSRNHFFRSLPQTVNMLDNLSTTHKHFNYSSADTVVLDFEFVQGVRSRTFETLQTLFSGKINPKEKPFGTQEMPRTELDVKSLLGPLQDLGYRTLWLEDLCPFWEWGMSKDLLVYSSGKTHTQLWQLLQKVLVNASIESIGNTLSSCRILYANGRPDPFHGLEKICYNGRHQHEYQLEYLTLYQEIATSELQPFFTFFETNVGHEELGKRIQQLDLSLADYLKFSASLKNTMTVLFSDHGNSYGTFVQESSEGRRELYHPFLFMIIPNEVQKFFGESKMKALIENQKRLISILDLHYTIKYIIESLHHAPGDEPHSSHSKASKNFQSSVSAFNKQFDVSRDGLLSPISPSRTCNIIPRIMPNLCICAGYEVVERSHANSMVLAMFAAGEMNNVILKQNSKGGHSVGGFGRCQRLRVDSVKNVQKSENQAGSHVIKMDMHVKRPGQEETEVFYIAVSLTLGGVDQSLTLVSYDRITEFSKFSPCTDKGVQTSLCICDINQEDKPVDRDINQRDELVDRDINQRDELVDRDINQRDELVDRDINQRDELVDRDINQRDELVDQHVNSSSDQQRVVKRVLGSESLSEYLDKSVHYPGMRLEVSGVVVDGSECLHIISQYNAIGVVYEAVSLCSVTINLHFILNPENLILSGRANSVLIRPGDTLFLAAGVQEDVSSEWSCQSSIQYQTL